MGIVTKTGDSGTTGLASGERVSKTNLRVAAFGVLDELISFMGLTRSFMVDKDIADYLKKIQEDLLILGTEIAKGNKKIVGEKLVFIEGVIDEHESRTKMPKEFILPGDSQRAAFLDVTRAICRRLERKLVALKEQGELQNENTLKYVNRLSDLLYIFARHVS